MALCVEETCQAVVKRLLALQIPVPTTEDWLEMADRFKSKWSFPNCIGAIDGKHVCIQAPPNSGSLYFNNKKTFSVVLLAVVDADYRFRVVHVGEYGRISDGGVYRKRGMELQTLGKECGGECLWYSVFTLENFVQAHSVAPQKGKQHYPHNVYFRQLSNTGPP